jgi:hypothetical protein
VWRVKDSGLDFVDLTGEEGNYQTASTFQTTAVTAGTSYELKVRALNLMGWGSFSDEFVIVTAKVPEKPNAPSTQIQVNNVRIAWTDPHLNSSPVQAYRVFVQNSQGVFAEDSVHCSGFKSAIITNKYCEIPMDYLRKTFLLTFDQLVRAKVQVSNEYGWSELSDANTDGAHIQTEPKQVVGVTENNELTTTQKLVFSWPLLSTLEETGGTEILSYNVQWD